MINALPLMTQRLPIVEIDGGTVTGGSDPRLIGSERFFVSVLTSDGGRLCEWDGANYADAVREARRALQAWQAVRIVDLTGAMDP